VCVQLERGYEADVWIIVYYSFFPHVDHLTAVSLVALTQCGGAGMRLQNGDSQQVKKNTQIKKTPTTLYAVAI